MAVKIRNGLYTCISGENGGPVANKFQIASSINESSYVSHHSAFEYYGVTDQVYYDVYVSSDMRFHDFIFDGHNRHSGHRGHCRHCLGLQLFCHRPGMVPRFLRGRHRVLRVLAFELDFLNLREKFF